MMSQTMGQAGMGCMNATEFARQDPGYTPDFWSKPGYAGHDQPHLFEGDRIVRFKTGVGEVRTAADLAAEVRAGGPAALGASSFMALMSPPDQQIAIRLAKQPSGYLHGESVRSPSGEDRKRAAEGKRGAERVGHGSGSAIKKKQRR